MKVTLEIHPQIEEELVAIQAREYTSQISDLVKYVETLDRQPERWTVKKGEDVYLLPVADIYRLVVEDKVVHIKTRSEEYTTALRLYQAKELLPSDFLQISQSEIIHLKYLDHLRSTPNGLVKIIMKNGDFTYSSRRYLKAIKEAIGL